MQLLQRLVAAPKLRKCLSCHLVGGDIIGVVPDQRGEFGKRGIGVSLGKVGHGEAVARKSVRRVLVKYLCQ